MPIARAIGGYAGTSRAATVASADAMLTARELGNPRTSSSQVRPAGRRLKGESASRTAAVAEIPPKVTSEGLGHATAAFAIQNDTHVILGMDEEVASSVAALILRPAIDASTPAVHKSLHKTTETVPE